ncbi:hypothetical protein VTN49DRAFT_2020 [Thermomyces lanuginosus]|uniref:uncharacterized protein n=1 Tax=Thermomyces lanuginosus TaxID=5541 RepID=UPI0037446AA3
MYHAQPVTDDPPVEDSSDTGTASARFRAEIAAMALESCWDADLQTCSSGTRHLAIRVARSPSAWGRCALSQSNGSADGFDGTARSPQSSHGDFPYDVVSHDFG